MRAVPKICLTETEIGELELATDEVVGRVVGAVLRALGGQFVGGQRPRRQLCALAG